ncbi:MAG: esterase family protein, partial [Thermoanaerobaculia bacterium]|nr:esterase family protein [Thermoanaerobaculia bacterium]
MFRLRHGAAILAAACAIFAAHPARASAARRVEHVASPAPATPVRVLVMTPPSYDAEPARRFPVLYFLHDGGGDEDVLFREGVADALDTGMRKGTLPEMLVVSPRGVGSWFVDRPDGGPGSPPLYATFLTKSLVPFVDARYRTIDSRGGRLAAGISMGGYGALRWGLAEPGLFCAAGGLSPAIQQMCWPSVEAMPFFMRPSLKRAFGDDPVRNVLRKNDLYAMLLDDPGLAARAPFLYVRCGTEDKYRIAEIVPFFDRYLGALGVAHEVVLETGVHDWPYWRRVFPVFVRAL